MHDLVEAYALGVLDPADRLAADLHLATCERCRALVDDYAGIADFLPQALAAASPRELPAAIKAGLLAAIATGSEISPRPIERRSFASVDLQRLFVGGDSLLEPMRA